jgi:hypothetical protein
MVKIEETSLVITLPHVCPLEALEDLQTGIIEVLKYQFIHFDNLTMSRQQLIDGNYRLLELLEATLQIQTEPRSNEMKP